jgi:hypothetical protein
MQWDASSSISDTVASHYPVSPDITNHSDSGSISCLKHQNVFFLFWRSGLVDFSNLGMISQYQ